MKKRVISAAVIIPLVAAAIYFGGIVFHALVMLVGLASIYEMNRCLGKTQIRFITWINYIYAIALSVAVFFGGSGNIFPVLLIFTLLALAVAVLLPRYTVKEAIVTIFVFVYPTTLILLLSALEKFGTAYIIAGIIASVITDTAAFFVGKKFGTTKLCPNISPNKTVAGGIGGAVATVILMPIYGLIFITGIKNITLVGIVVWICFGLLCGIFAQFGDLFASLVKRYCGVKDYSNLIPGHGGIMDRLDSVMFTTTLVFVFKILGII